MRYYRGDDYDSDVAGENNLEELKTMRKKLNWEIEGERYKFLREFISLSVGWYRSRPNLEEMFRPEEIDWILMESVKSINDDHINNKQINFVPTFIEFVANSHYKDKPDVDGNDKPSSRRTTALHCAVRLPGYSSLVKNLFKIYDRFDVNYTDELGLTHLHVACKYGCEEIVAKFLEFGHDPNCLEQKKADSPLHYALRWGNKEVTELLLRHGADPISVNNDGLTPLHFLCLRKDDDDSAKIFFEINDANHQTVPLDVVDNLGRTPLHMAVASLLPGTVDMLLNRGADMSSFVFPTEIESYFVEKYNSKGDLWSDLKLTLACRALAVVDRLEKRGYQLDRSDALTIVKFFAKHEIFNKSADLDYYLRCRQGFVVGLKELMLTPSLSLHDLIFRSHPKEEEKLLTYSDYSKFENSHEFRSNREEFRQACTARLCEIISRRFFRQWALEPLLELTRHYHLPILCCEIIIKKLKSEDLMRLCLAADIDAVEDSQARDVRDEGNELEELHNTFFEDCVKSLDGLMLQYFHRFE
ncbi:tankyrase-2-like [Trichogramma pretiosum]|uniref:tankyrase-2-like n=1 Tax=Trichogramma pretiosum TaxID=7493 RepID=UPI000C71AE62|nr:tankyrase-2-like [Trichogramma pretiosum]